MKTIVNKITQEAFDSSVDWVKKVSGGDINDAFLVKTSKSVYFMKLNTIDYRPDMFLKEANGLNAITNNSFFRVPKILKIGLYRKYQYLFLEFIKDHSATSYTYKTMGKKLAEMHQRKQPYFGDLPESFNKGIAINKNYYQWDIYFSECKIMPIVEKLYNQKKFGKKEVTHANTFCKKLLDIFPQESPSLIHGDLWSGNYMVDHQYDPVLIDPDVSYSHREIDIAMTSLFGGFTQDFYNAYNDEYPLQKQWQNRLDKGQLYPLLNHALLFGGSYIDRCKEILMKF